MPHPLEKIFDDKKWNFRSTDGTDEHYKDIYYSYIKMLGRLSPEEQTLILKLTELFLYLPLNSYYNLAKEIAKIVNDLITDKHKNIFIVALSDPKDKGYNKSGTTVVGLFKAATIQTKYNFNRLPFKLLDMQDVLKEDFNSRNDSLIVFVDDFIGSTDTAISALDYFNNNIRNATDDLYVVCFVAMELAKAQLSASGYTVKSIYDLKRGISDSGLFSDPGKYLDIMEKIEDRIGIYPFLRFGWKRTEATLALARTPDNTFPVFWWIKDTQGNDWPAPFPAPDRV